LHGGPIRAGRTRIRIWARRRGARRSRPSPRDIAGGRRAYSKAARLCVGGGTEFVAGRGTGRLAREASRISLRERSRFCQSQALAEIDKKMGKFNSLQRTLWPSQRIANPSAGAGSPRSLLTRNRLNSTRSRQFRKIDRTRFDIATSSDLDPKRISLRRQGSSGLCRRWRRKPRKLLLRRTRQQLPVFSAASRPLRH
jgi:hypothetical protein